MPDASQTAPLHESLALPEVMEIFKDAADSAQALVKQLQIPMPAELLSEWSKDAGLALQRMADAYELIAERIGEEESSIERPRCR